MKRAPIKPLDKDGRWIYFPNTKTREKTYVYLPFYDGLPVLCASSHSCHTNHGPKKLCVTPHRTSPMKLECGCIALFNRSNVWIGSKEPNCKWSKYATVSNSYLCPTLKTMIEKMGLHVFRNVKRDRSETYSLSSQVDGFYRDDDMLFPNNVKVVAKDTDDFNIVSSLWPYEEWNSHVANIREEPKKKITKLQISILKQPKLPFAPVARSSSPSPSNKQQDEDEDVDVDSPSESEEEPPVPKRPKREQHTLLPILPPPSPLLYPSEPATSEDVQPITDPAMFPSLTPWYPDVNGVVSNHAKDVLPKLLEEIQRMQMRLSEISENLSSLMYNE